jgi:hypothetical protein
LLDGQFQKAPLQGLFLLTEFKVIPPAVRSSPDNGFCADLTYIVPYVSRLW